MRDSSTTYRHRIIKAISQQVLAAVTDTEPFEAQGLFYSCDNQVDLSIDVRFILFRSLFTP